jgi:hypothetical protein
MPLGARRSRLDIPRRGGLADSHAFRRPAKPAGYLDLAALALALPVFLLADLPMLGYAAAAAAWLAQRALQLALQRRAAAADDPRTIVGIAAASMIARGWLVAGAIFAAGLADSDAGLAAAVLSIALFTIYFAVQMVLRPFGRG